MPANTLYVSNTISDKTPMFKPFNVEKEMSGPSVAKSGYLAAATYSLTARELMHTVNINSGRSSGSKTDVEESLVESI